MNRLGKAIVNLVTACFTLGLGVMTELSLSAPTQAAERLTTYVGPVQVSIPIDDLETFAQEGKASGTLALLVRSLDDRTVEQLRIGLQRPIRVNAALMGRLTYIPMIEQIIQSLGRGLETTSGLNGFYAIRSALIRAAVDNPEGWTAIDVLRAFPSRDIRVDIGFLRAAARELTTTISYRNDAVELIIGEALQERATEPRLAYAELPSLSQPGPYGYTKDQFTFEIEASRSTLRGLSSGYPLRVDVYTPDGVTGPVPVVVFSHGFGGRLSDGETIGRHLTSHGLAVVVPEHVGTTDTYRSVFLQGSFGDIMSPMEYASRPLDIIYTLDELEALTQTDPRWANRLNLQQVGVMGASFGGLTALASAGASFNPATLNPLCAFGLTQFNPSFLLQCHARFLPPATYNFADPRIKAVFPQYPMGATLYGPEGMADIQIPVMLLAGSHDILAPSVYEQIPLFSWLKSPHKYLALMVPGNHFSTSSPSNVARIPEPLRGPDAQIGRRYLETLSVAFFKTYLSDVPDTAPYRSYLTSSYAGAMSQEEMRLYLIQSLTPEQLAVAYGGVAPGRDRLTALAAPPASSRSIREDIEQTGLLRVGIRTDAAPLGFIDEAGNWTGFCFDFAKSLAAYLSEESDRPLGIDLIPLPSDLDNRVDLVGSGAVHLECGPNTITPLDTNQVTFSEPFLVSGTQFLVNANQSERINVSAGLAGVRTGVLQRTTTEQWLKGRFPQADLVPFDGTTGTRDAVRAVAGGTLDAFANEGLLLLGELARQGLPLDGFALVPSQPLTCDFYGLLLPTGDSEWRVTVNRFLRSEAAIQAKRAWLGDLSTNALDTLDYCFRQDG